MLKALHHLLDSSGRNFTFVLIYTAYPFGQVKRHNFE